MQSNFETMLFELLQIGKKQGNYFT